MVTVIDATLPPAPDPGGDRTPRVGPDKTATSARGARRGATEPLSPFVVWSDETRATIELGDLSAERAPRNVFVEMVSAPRAFAARILEPRQLQAVIVTAIVAVVLGTAAFATMVRLDTDMLVGDVLAGLAAGPKLALSTLLAIGAALGPIHAAGILVAARVPLARLVAVMLGATAVGALALAPLGPVVRFLHDYDPMWAGPLSLLAAFGLSAAITGTTLWRLLIALASEVVRAQHGERAVLSEADAFRVGIVARLALVFMAYTSMLALWGLGAFS